MNGDEHITTHPMLISPVKYPDGTRIWYLNGERHRVDGPAVERANGERMWYQNGRLHRTDGPALISSNGDHTWYANGRPHRTDGPAYEDERGNTLWYINGKSYSFMEWANKLYKTPEEITILSLQYNITNLD